MKSPQLKPMEDVPTKAMRGRLKERSGGHEGHGKGHSSHGTFETKWTTTTKKSFSQKQKKTQKTVN